jgi:type IV pilus assembly protein PilV
MNTFQVRLHAWRAPGVQRRRSQRGASLIEVLVAVVLLSFGIVGMAGMQLAGSKFNHSASLRSQATSLAYDLADRARANLDACPAAACAYATPLATAFDGTAAQACGLSSVAATAAAMAAIDVNQWKSCLEDALPDGRGQALRLAANTDFVDQCGVTHASTATEVFVVEVNWNDGRLQAAADPRDCVVVRTEVGPL